LLLALNIGATIFMASGPETLITAIAPAPEGVAKATMVSFNLMRQR
jgi:hypothetical protein